MAAAWKVDLAAACRRLEAEIPHLRGLCSFVLYGDRVQDLEFDGALASVTIRSPSRTRPIRKIIFKGGSEKLALLGRHAVNLSSALDAASHRRIGTNWPHSYLTAQGRTVGWTKLAHVGEPLSTGLIEWTLALHAFAMTTPDADLMDLPDLSALMRPDEVGDRIWYPSGPYASYIAEPAEVSAKFADWFSHEGMADCPVELQGEGKPPIVLGRPMPKPLTHFQYDVVKELVRVWPNGLSVPELNRLTGCEHPGHVLLSLIGQRPRNTTKAIQDKTRELTESQKRWAEVILPPGGQTGLGWRLSRA